MKKVIVSISMLLACVASLAGTTNKMYLWLKSGEKIEYTVETVDSITFVMNVADEEQQPVQQGKTPTETMQELRDGLQTYASDDCNTQRTGVDYGEVKSYQYYSTTREKMAPVNILLPPGYNTNEKYPVLYILHGIGGDQNSMLDASMGVQNILGNAIADGAAKKMIVVFPYMFTSKTLTGFTGFNQESVDAYDNFINDLVTDLMPWMEQNFSIATGRNNTAITGFSMGGREALYIGTQRTDLFAYVGAACPAPGILPTQDAYMTHVGMIKNEAEFKYPAGNPDPWILLISGGTNDGVVGTYPEQYHNILTNNGVDHVWHSVPGTGHDGNTVRPHLYNYYRYLFKY